MSKYTDLQQELTLLWSSRVKTIKGLTETGRFFPLSKPMFSVLHYSQKSYRAAISDLKNQIGAMRKQLRHLQQEINTLVKIVEHPAQRRMINRT